MYQLEKLGKLEIGKCYVYAIGKRLIVTNMNRASLTNTKKIMYSLNRFDKLNLSDEYIETYHKILHEELKNIGSLHKYVNLDFNKLYNETETRHYVNVQSDNFGGGYDMNEIRIILI